MSTRPLSTKIRQITPKQLKQLHDAGPLFLLDVREPFERALATIPLCAGVREIFIPMGEIPTRVDELRHVVGESVTPLVVYCHHGVRSLMVAQWLTRQGFAGIYNLEGGIESYSLEVDANVARY